MGHHVIPEIAVIFENWVPGRAAHSTVVLVAWSWRGAEDVGVYSGGGLMPGVPVVEVLLLGPVQAVRADCGVPLGGPRQWALLAQVRALAQGARIPLHSPAAVPQALLLAEAGVACGLTGQELPVLRLLASGRTKPQIGAELCMSPKTASVDVTRILRKLGVSSRVQAAALAEGAGLLQAEELTDCRAGCKGDG